MMRWVVRMAGVLGLAMFGTLPGAAAPSPTAAEAIAQFPDVAAFWQATPEGGMRHIKSGLDCGPPQSESGTLRLLGTTPTPVAGDDAFCMFEDAAGARYTLYATRIPGAQQADMMNDAVAAIQQAFGPLRKGLGIKVIMREGLPLAKAVSWADSAGFIAALQGKGNVSTVVRLALIGEWVVKMRSTSAADGIAAGEKPTKAQGEAFVAVVTGFENAMSLLYLNALATVAEGQGLLE
ncbi:hypothetical protein sos41_12430 [Alphaproteobacteria bacterium SO-S41]|nr:hypothetical protein sos41_12430 [Alphaproteobacteria bacterium SO-S41]